MPFEYLDEYCDLLEQIELDNLLNKSDEIIEEPNINSSDIGIPDNKGKSRYIMITNSGKSSHQGRMKVSKYGVKINRNTSHEEYISIYRKDDNTIECEGSLKNIKMSRSEYQYYVDLFIRNENIIQLVKTGNGQYDNYVDNALIDDERDRLSGLIINRDINGDAEIYNKGNLIGKRNIKGEMI